MSLCLSTPPLCTKGLYCILYNRHNSHLCVSVRASSPHPPTSFCMFDSTSFSLISVGMGAVGVTASGQLSTLLLALLDDATYHKQRLHLTIYLSIKKAKRVRGWKNP